MAPQRPIGFWLKLVDELINQQFDALITEHGVTRRQWQVLNLLSNAPTTRTELATALAPFIREPQPESLTEELDELVASDWVERRHGAGSGMDGAVAFALTDHGRTAWTRLSEVVDRSRETVARGISLEEYGQTLDVLERMARNLGWQDPVP